MGLVLIDGLEDLTSWIPSGGACSLTTGRNGNGVINTGSTAGVLSIGIPSALQADTITVGFAMKQPSGQTTVAFLVVASDNGATDHVSFAGDGSGRIVASRNFSTILTSSVCLLTGGVWQYIEVQIRLHDTLGFITIRVGGVVVATATGLDTKNAGTKTVFDTVRLGVATFSNNVLDDLILYCAASPGDPFVGDIAVETLYPNGNGNANQWLGSDGDSTNNYLLVDEVGTPVTTDYVSDATSGHQDLYTLTDPSVTTGSVVGICHSAYMAKSDASAKQARIMNRHFANVYSPALDLGSGFAGYHFPLAQDPETSAAWTFANLNGLQTGVEVL